LLSGEGLTGTMLSGIDADKNGITNSEIDTYLKSIGTSVEDLAEDLGVSTTEAYELMVENAEDAADAQKDAYERLDKTKGEGQTATRFNEDLSIQT
jgi:predicted ArsR family transcriptional regulator